MTLANRIQEIRTANQLNKVQFGKLIGVSHTAVALMESGETKSLKFSTLMKIEQETGYRANWIDTGKGERFASEIADDQRERVIRKIASLSPDKKRQLSAMTISEISAKIRALKTEQQTAIQAMLDSWESQNQQND